MRLTKKLMKELHTELWLWLAENPKKEKNDWPRWEENGGDIPKMEAECFACEYAARHGKRPGFCCCPLDFPDWKQANGTVQKCLGGLFDKWDMAIGKARSALAKQIAELPIRKRR